MTATQFARQLQSLASDFPAAAQRAANAVAVVAAGAVRTGLTAGVSPDGAPFRPLGWARPRGGSKPLLDTGVLRASVSAEADGSGVTLRANAPGARLHQEGGIVTPKRAKALTIPLTREAARAGGARNFPRRLFVLGRKDGGNGALAERTPKGGLILQYLLRRSVTVPARHYLGVSAATAERIGTVIAFEQVRAAEGA